MEPQKQPQIGWIGKSTPSIDQKILSALIFCTGLGAMGIGMATNLQKHLQSTKAPDLHFTNRTISRGDSLKLLGAVPCPTIGGLVEISEIVFISVSDDDALNSVVSEIVPLKKGSLAGKIIIDTTTVHPDTTRAVSKQLTDAGAIFAAAPIFGASPVAAAGQLLFIVAGPPMAVQAISPYLKGVMGRGSILLGEDVAKASLMKTSGNFMTAAMMELIAEVLVFAEKTGLGVDAMESLIEQQYGPLAHAMCKRMTSGGYAPPKGQQPISGLDLAIKDVGHGISTAKSAGAQLKVGEIALAHLQEAKKFQDGQEGRSFDSSSMYGVVRKDAGLDFESEVVKK